MILRVYFRWAYKSIAGAFQAWAWGRCQAQPRMIRPFQMRFISILDVWRPPYRLPLISRQ